jgi:hypothetical protein
VKNHLLEHGVEELAGLLGVAVGEQLHRALQVGEQHGDLLALTFQGFLGEQDPLGEVLGGVGGGRAEALGRRRRRCERLAAALAESVARVVRRVAVLADEA